MRIRILVCKNWDDKQIVACVAPQDCYNAVVGETAIYKKGEEEKFADILVEDDYVEEDADAVNAAAEINGEPLYPIIAIMKRFEVEWHG